MDVSSPHAGAGARPRAQRRVFLAIGLCLLTAWCAEAAVHYQVLAAADGRPGLSLDDYRARWIPGAGTTEARVRLRATSRRLLVGVALLLGSLPGACIFLGLRTAGILAGLAAIGLLIETAGCWALFARQEAAAAAFFGASLHACAFLGIHLARPGVPRAGRDQPFPSFTNHA